MSEFNFKEIYTLIEIHNYGLVVNCNSKEKALKFLEEAFRLKLLKYCRKDIWLGLYDKYGQGICFDLKNREYKEIYEYIGKREIITYEETNLAVDKKMLIDLANSKITNTIKFDKNTMNFYEGEIFKTGIAVHCSTEEQLYSLTKQYLKLRGCSQKQFTKECFKTYRDEVCFDIENKFLSTRLNLTIMGYKILEYDDIIEIKDWETINE